MAGAYPKYARLSTRIRRKKGLLREVPAQEALSAESAVSPRAIAQSSTDQASDFVPPCAQAVESRSEGPQARARAGGARLAYGTPRPRDAGASGRGAKTMGEAGG